MTPEEFQTGVARAALAVARRYGFALAGGQALMAHGIVDRPTEDVDLFTDSALGVRDGGRAIRSALEASGYLVSMVPGLDFEGYADELAEFEVRQGPHVLRLQLARFSRRHRPVGMAVGPVLHVDDVIGSKVAALAGRAEPRDFIDVAGALEHYPAAALMELGRQADPALSDEDFAAALHRLDRLDDKVFTDIYGCSPAQVAEIRSRFHSWPR